jgi:glycosyltransferase involved in cell wall biosynthesis
MGPIKVTRLKTIVLSAFAANPTMSSETGIGWSFIRATALSAATRDARVIAVMNKRSQAPVEQQLRAEGLSHVVEAIGIDMPVYLKFLKDPRLTRIEYVVWWLLARNVMKKLEIERNVVLAHHVTFATEVFPTPITAFSSKVLKVWGPIGSAGDPNVYRVKPITRGIRKEAATQVVRDAIASFPASFFGRRVDLVIAQNSAVADTFERKGIRTRVFPNVVLKPELRDAIRDARASRDSSREGTDHGLRILCVGHLVPRKRFDLSISVLSVPALSEAHVEILGKPLEGVSDTLPDLARALGVSDRVTFSGKLPRDQVLAAMANADVLFHPSGREGASGVIGEATAVGIPIVCFAETGASSVLIESGSSGIAIGASPHLSIVEIANALVTAATMPRISASLWTEDRFQQFCGELLDEALAQQPRNPSLKPKSP